MGAKSGHGVWVHIISSKMSQVFGFALQRVALFVTLYCVDVGKGVWECVWGNEREREREGHTEGERSGKRECVSKDGASGALLRIEIWSRSTKPLRHSPYLGGWYQDLSDSERSMWIIPPTPPTAGTIWPSVNFKYTGSAAAAHQSGLPSLPPHRLGVEKWSAQIVH